MDKIIKNAKLSFGTTVSDPSWNVPGQYKDRQTQYYMGETDRFKKKFLKYASDFFDATAQGLYGPDEAEWVPCKIRLAEVVRPSSAIQREFDDYKQLLLEEPALPYIPQGTKFNCMGSIWLMMNPLNVSNGDGGGIVRRCRATWNHLDYYGNVLQEPLVIETDRASANSDDSQQWDNITKGYFNITCQSNQWTNQLGTNSRLVLGKGAYRITGFTDFFEEFTGDFDSTRLIRFTARYEEPNDEIDDMKRRIAGGLTFRWDIDITGTPVITEGTAASLTPISRRNGEIVTNTDELPVSYGWESSDESVCTVDETGNITGIAAGTAKISCVLLQNPEFMAEYSVDVEGAGSGNKVAFLQDVPVEMRMFETASIEAAWFENGEITDNHVKITASGPESTAYTAEVSENRVTITCYSGSNTPLTITASHGNDSISAEIALKGI